MPRLFGQGRIKSNKKIAALNRDLYSEMVAESFRTNELIHDGLLFYLKREDKNWQEFLNNCDDYPYRLYFGNQKEMEGIFKVMHERIMDVILEREYFHDFSADIEQQQRDLLITH